MQSSELNINPDIGNLKDYNRAKLLLAEQLRIIRHTLRTNNMEMTERKFGDLMIKLADDRFTLSVLGQFKRGKSTLMNSIIGKDVLPTGVVPVTSAITILKYGPSERLVIRRENSAFPGDFPVSSLAEYVTEQNNPSNTKKVISACLELPVPFLRYGIEFVDTPGIGSAIRENTATTYGFLPECDSVIFVTGTDTPLTGPELQLLKDIKDYVARTFFVVNKTDLVSPGERSEILSYIERIIRSEIDNDQIRIYPVSSLQGFHAKMTGDPELYKESGLKDLEEDLGSFLSEYKSVSFLTSVIFKAITFLENEFKQKMQGTALSYREDSNDKEGYLSFLQNSLENLKELHSSITQGRIEDFEKDQRRKIRIPAESLLQQVESDKPEPDRIDFENDLNTRGCAVCNHIYRQVNDFLCNWQYKLSSETDAQAYFASQKGFCSLHTWQLLSVSSPHGASVGFTSVAEEIAEIIKANSGMTGNDVRQALLQHRECDVCKLHETSEMNYINELASFLKTGNGTAVYRKSQGVCLAHLSMLLDTVSEEETRKFLLSHAAEFFSDVAEEMRTYSLKFETLRQALKNSDEEDAYKRAVVHIAGDRNIVAPWPMDREI